MVRSARDCSFDYREPSEVSIHWGYRVSQTIDDLGSFFSGHSLLPRRYVWQNQSISPHFLLICLSRISSLVFLQGISSSISFQFQMNFRKKKSELAYLQKELTVISISFKYILQTNSALFLFFAKRQSAKKESPSLPCYFSDSSGR